MFSSGTAAYAMHLCLKELATRAGSFASLCMNRRSFPLNSSRSFGKPSVLMFAFTSQFRYSSGFRWCLVLASVLCHPGIGGSDQPKQFVPQPLRSGRIGMHPIEHLCCQNAQCPDAGLRGRGNLTFRGWSGKGHRIRMAYCRTGTARFSERKGTVLEQARLPDATALDVLNHIREGCGTRA